MFFSTIPGHGLHPRRASTSLACALVVIGWCLPSPAADRAPLKEELEERIVRGPSLSDLLAYAYRASPMVAAARSSWNAVVGRHEVESALPDPELTAVFWPMSLPGDWRTRRFEAMLSQALPWPGMRGTAGSVVEADARVARLELDRAARDAAVGVRESYHELLYLAEARRIAGQNKELLDHLRKLGETSYGEGRLPLFDVLKAQSQSGQVMYDMILLEELEKAEKTRLNALLNRESEAPIGPLTARELPPLAYSLDEIRRLGEANREEVRIAGAGQEKMRAEARMAEFRNRPEFMVGLQYEYDAPEGAPAENMFGLQFGLSLPLWGGKRSGRLAEAAARVEQSRAMLEASINDTRAMIGEAYFRVRNAERLVTLYRDQLLPQAARGMENAETWYRRGEGSFTDFVETQAVWYNFQLALARARADQGRFLARLEALAGRSLTDRSVAPAEAPEAAP